MATDPELLDRPATTKAKTRAKSKPATKRRGPTIASLRAKVERARHEGANGPSLGAMSRADREKVLFG